MKLARIMHLRCHERNLNDPETFVWVPDDMTEEQLEQLVVAAVKSYDRATAEFDAANVKPRRSWGATDYSRYPDKTVREVDEIKAAEEAAYLRWEAIRKEARKGFSYHLRDVSAGAIETFHSRPPELSVDCDWGHRHGQEIEYDETKRLDRDVPGKVKEQGYF